MVRYLARHFSNQGFLVRQEVSAGYGRADLVLVKLNPKKCAIRKKRKQVTPLLKENFFQVLRQLPDIDDRKKLPPRGIDELVQSVPVSKSYLKYHLLRELEDNGYVKKIDDNYYYKVNGWVPLVSEMIAIEAKLRDWRRGFIQANRYKYFADKTYLAILAQYRHLVDDEILARQNVGLFILSEDGKNVEEIICPKSQDKAKQDKRNFVSELFLYDALSN